MSPTVCRPILLASPLLLVLGVAPLSVRAAEIDVIVALDSSPSMVEEAAALQSSLNAFATSIIGSGHDLRVIAISADSG